MDTRRMIIAMLAAFAFFIAYQLILNQVLPPKKPAAAQPSEIDQALSGQPSEPAGGAQARPQPPSAVTQESTSKPGFVFTAAPDADHITLGGPGRPLELEFTPRGAAVVTARITEKKINGQYVHRVDVDGNEPFVVLAPLVDESQTIYSFATQRIRIEEFNAAEFWLHDLIWAVDEVDVDAGTVRFSTTLRSDADDRNVLRLTKRYRLDPKQPLIHMQLEMHNLSDGPLTVILVQDGPVGILQIGMRWDMRYIFAAYRNEDRVAYPQTVPFSGVKGGQSDKLSPDDDAEPFLWAAVSDKYFAVFTRAITEGDAQSHVAAILPVKAAPGSLKHAGQATWRTVTRQLKIAAGQKTQQKFEICIVPKDADVLEAVNPEFVDARGLNYVAIKSADQRCMCTFWPLPQIMTGLLKFSYMLVGNYGVAIIILVLIVRTLLHPLTVFQQKSMYRMQESMVRIQPKMSVLKEKYANDKVRLNQEMMKLWGEENVNPAGQFVAFLPMFVQMPILVALWSALNTDIHLRNAPFDGWWITDLSRPDALITFGGAGLTIPILSWLPLLGQMFKNIPALNVLPVLMGVSMWLQQKYMPKPGMQAKLEAAKKQPPAPRKPGGGMTPQEQMRQQQMMANMMAVMFPLMFYYMPSGLNLYWMSTNVYGIAESLMIRKQLAREKERRDKHGEAPKKPKKPGMMSKMLKRMAAQAEELQKQADQASGRTTKKKEGGGKRKKK